MDAIEDDILKVLGLRGFLHLYYKLGALDLPSKRSVLSATVRLFDPLGFFLSVIFLAKLIMQRIWVSKIAKDDPLPTDINLEWSFFFWRSYPAFRLFL